MDFETADVLVALGGDTRNTVPKTGITTAEIAVLCAIHGSDAVHDIVPCDAVISRSAREERERLLLTYPARTAEGDSVVMTVYPGNPPLMHETLADLGLPAELYKPTEREKPKATKKAARKMAPAAKPEPIMESSSDDVTGLFDVAD